MMKKPTNEYDKLMRDARKRIAAMDKIDGSSVEQGQVDSALRTVMCAIQSAIETGDWTIVAEAQVMLSQIELRYRPADLKAGGFYLQEK